MSINELAVDYFYVSCNPVTKGSAERLKSIIISVKLLSITD